MEKNQNENLQHCNRVFINYIPAQISNKKICRVVYYALNPLTNKLERIVVKCNKSRSKSARLQLARLVANNINEKLMNGWNPFISKDDCNLVKIGDAINVFLKKSSRLRKDSLRSYNSFCAYFIRWLEENNYIDSYCVFFSVKQAKDLISTLEKTKISSTTINNYIKFYRLLFNFFINENYISENCFNKISVKKEDEKKRQIIPEEIRKSISDYLISNNKIEFYMVCLLCYKCLIRPAEILRLKIKDIDYKNKILSLPSEITKSHKARVVAIPDEILLFLNTIRNTNINNYIFSKNFQTGVYPLTSREVGTEWAKMRKVLGFSMSYQFYSLKDTGITELLDAGVPAKLVKDLAGHSSLEMTEKYVHVSNAKKILELNNLEF